MQPLQTDAIGLAALILLVLTWILFALLFILRKKPPQVEEVKTASVSKWGIIMQSVAFAGVWAIHRTQWWPFSASRAGEIALASIAVLIGIASNFLCLRAIQTLGKQWTYAARVIQGHELITAGPYSLVRNPIYLGMFGLMVSAGLVFTTWWVLLVAIAVFLAGSEIRIRAEESLLRETFGEQFELYAKRVPAFFPRIF